MSSSGMAFILTFSFLSFFFNLKGKSVTFCCPFRKIPTFLNMMYSQFGDQFEVDPFVLHYWLR